MSWASSSALAGLLICRVTSIATGRGDRQSQHHQRLAVHLIIFTVVTIVIGQTTPLILFLIAVAWRLLEARRDRTAGFALAWLTIKPQLTILVLPGVLLWAARCRRWGVVVGLAATLAVLALASWLLIPGWLGQMLDAPRQTPPPTEYFPWIGTTWFLLLKSAGFRSWSFWCFMRWSQYPCLRPF